MDFSIISYPLLILTSILAYVSVNHLMMYIYRKKGLVNLSFSILCFVTCLYYICCIGLYNAKSFEDAIFWQSNQFTVLPLFVISLSMYLQYHVGEYDPGSRFIIVSSSILMVLFFLLNIFFRYNELTLSTENPALLIMDVGGLVHARVYECTPGFLLELQYVSMMYGLAGGYYILLRKYKHKSARPMLISMSILFVGATNDILVGIRVYSFVYIFEYTFFIIIISMARNLLIEFVELHDEVEGLNVDLEKQVKYLEKNTLRINELNTSLEEKSQDLENKNKELLSLSRLKDEFLANTSHELRTPLNGIIGLADSMDDGACGGLSTSVHHHLRLIISSGKRLSKLIDDILDFSKLRHGDLALNLKSVNLSSVVDLVFEFTKPIIENHDKIKLINRVADELPPVVADEDRLHQILINLIGNSIKFTQEGTIEVSAKKINDNIAIQVSDTGIGIQKQKQESIFEAFTQADGSIERMFGGTGLGLSITKKLVELHGGTMTLQSEYGKGTIFTFTLSAAKNQKTSDAQPEKNADPQNDSSKFVTEIETNTTNENMTHSYHRMDQKEADGNIDILSNFTGDKKGSRILAVDDDPVNLQVIVSVLGLRGFEVLPVQNGEEALELVESSSTFDLILLDLMMPKMSGIDVCKKLREKFPLYELPIIILTAKTQLSDHVISLDSGANDYLIKPFDKQVLCARVQTLVTMRHSFLKARENEQLKRTQQMLVETAHRAGMADVAVDLLHNVNNVLNSLLTSGNMIREKLQQSDLSSFSKANEIVSEHLDDFDTFYTEDPKGRLLLKMYIAIEKNLRFQYTGIEENVQSLLKSAEQINQIVNAQERYVKGEKLVQNLVLQSIAEDVLLINQQSLEGIGVSRSFAPVPDIQAHQPKLVYVIDAVLKNSVDALETLPPETRTIKIATSSHENWVFLNVCHNGSTLTSNERKKIFEQDFVSENQQATTGMHNCANYMREMGGDISAQSDPDGPSTTYTVKLKRS